MPRAAPRDAFRRLLAAEGCVHPASVCDPLAARIADALGFECGILAGSTAALAVLGSPDLVLLTLTEFAEQARRVTRAADLPLLVDADHGYGNALSAQRTVQELEAAGIAAMTLEDTALPAPYGSTAPQLTSVEEGAGKLRAALAARRDPGLVILGRTGALAISGLDDTLARVRAYAATGVDGLFFSSVSSREEITAIRAVTQLPLVVAFAGTAVADRDWLAGQGVRIALQGHQPIMAATQAVEATLRALREGTAPGELTGLAPAAMMARLTQAEEYRQKARDYLGA
ncbi:oxaloacetate decarboxylase [Pseudoroseomonas deserti]|uniref:Oxaloacetate decarboxylase n=1 Tax=Teichococcus deserti TaxID=1817963 RepID=A0A1V2H5W3_9PROT|nr:isocitrate lyase/phosphoenolpyruvate mutase family protein [Pseudoroseomonas deserti]ONG56638.1 oxaloacetate decarboxylase [Pseudoroseomonas deserti]